MEHSKGYNGSHPIRLLLAVVNLAEAVAPRTISLLLACLTSRRCPFFVN
jgi:hypothetical protein